MSGFEKRRLGELIEIKHGFAFEGRYFVDNGPYVLLTPGNFIEAGGFRHRGEKQKHYDGPVPPEFVLNPGDLLVAMTEQGEGLLGSTAFVPTGKPCLHNQRLGLIRPRPGAAVDLKFIYYLFNSRGVRAQIRGSSSGTKVRHTSPSRVYAVEAALPEVDTQRRIASILGAHDDLIEVNRRRIALLEEMGRRLFEEWFVLFRYPGHGVGERIKGARGTVPDGWRVSQVRELVERQRNGKVYREKDCERSGRIMVIDQSSDEVLGFHSNNADHNAASADPIAIFGDHTCKMQLLVTPFSIGPNTVAFKAKGSINIYYLFELVRDLTRTREYKRHWNDLMSKEVLVAPVALAASYAEVVKPLFQLQEHLQRQNRNLREQRDLLLPRLISGELSVSTAERELETAA
jgi:type I restriction enzyme S subunit